MALPPNGRGADAFKILVVGQFGIFVSGDNSADPQIRLRLQLKFADWPLKKSAMPIVRIALANVREPKSPAETVKLAFARPDGSLLCHQPYGEDGLLVADLDLDEATGELAQRC